MTCPGAYAPFEISLRVLPVKNSLDNRLAGKEPEVISDVDRLGMWAAMDKHGIKSGVAFNTWLKKHRYIASIDPLAGLSGGARIKWLKDHQRTIEDCITIFGRSWVLTNFRIQEDTLSRLLKSPNRPAPFTRADRLQVELNEARTQIARLEHMVNNGDNRLTTGFVLNAVEKLVARLKQLDNPIDISVTDLLTEAKKLDLLPEPN